jgi:hypothetical protein
VFNKDPPLGPARFSQIQPDQSGSYHPTLSLSLRSILILFTHLRLGLASNAFLLAFPPITYMHSSSLPFSLHVLPISSVKGTSYEAPHLAVLSNILSLHLFEILFPAPSVYVPPSMPDTKFHTHVSDEV